MASEKSFPASKRKLEKARREGDVAKSSILSGSVIISISMAYIYYSFAEIDQFIDSFLEYLRLIQSFGSNNMLEYAKIALLKCSKILLTYFGLLVVVAVGVESAQVGFCISLKHLALNFNRLNPFDGFKKNILKHSENEKLMLGLLVEILKMLSVIFSIFAIIFYQFEKYYLLFVTDCDKTKILILFFQSIVQILVIVLTLGAIDYFYLRIKRTKRLMMDVNEFKQEMRESEGDPHTKGLRKQLHQELALKSIIGAVRKAKVLVIGK